MSRNLEDYINFRRFYHQPSSSWTPRTWTYTVRCAESATNAQSASPLWSPARSRSVASTATTPRRITYASSSWARVPAATTVTATCRKPLLSTPIASTAIAPRALTKEPINVRYWAFAYMYVCSICAQRRLHVHVDSMATLRRTELATAFARADSR